MPAMTTPEGPAVRARTRARTAVRRRTRWLGSVLALTAAVTACEPAPVHRRLAMVPIGTTPLVNEPSAADEPIESVSTTSAPSAGAPCIGAEVDALDTALRGCEVPMPKASELPSVTKDKLEISLSASKPQVAPGGRLELTLTLRNRQGEPLALVFTGDPSPRVELEALDAKGKRADRPAGKPPASRPDAKGREAKASRFTLAPNGVARVHLAWDAVKLRWAPERQKTWEGHGPPTAPAGPLPRGKYTLRAVVPLLGVFERGDVELPKIVVDVG